MKIGILTLFHGNDNWGGNLQGVALKTFIESEYPNDTVDILVYRSSKNLVYDNKFKQLKQYSVRDIFKRGLSIIYNRIKKPLGNRLKQRKILFSEFRKPYLTNMHVYTDFSLNEMERDYDVLICGSDQIWNPNVARPGYFLKDIGSSCKKISYAASIARDTLSEYEKTVMAPLIDQFDYISVREKTAKTLLTDCVRKNITEVLDPAFLLDEEAWTKYMHLSAQKDKPYALAFFFSDSLKYREKISNFCTQRGLRLLFIPFSAGYIKNDELGECERCYDVGPREFLNLFKNTEYVFTDSFHGAVFSIIFQKHFLVFERDANGHTSKNSRLHDLLDKFDLRNHLIVNFEDINLIEVPQINYKKVNEKLYEHRKQSIDFLHQAIGKSDCAVKPRNKVDCLYKEQCCGCALCSESCPKHCISMKQDSEGFFYPVIDMQECIDCGKCLKTCKDKNIAKETINAAYIGYNKNNDIRYKSSSGGLFYEIALQILETGGAVYGAAFDDDFSVKHIRVDNLTDLETIMTSKYVQSNIEGIYSRLLTDLQNKKNVLFSGTPCQVSAVKTFAMSYDLLDNLYLVDFVCHGVPSPGVWKSYLSSVVKKCSISKVNFRDKTKRGWHDYHLLVSNEKECFLCESHDVNAFMHSFLTDKNLRLSCYNCLFKGKNYASDLTLGDAWKIEIEKPEWADNKGTSLFITRTEKGERIVSSLAKNFIYERTDYRSWAKFNPSIVTPANYNIDRDEFFYEFCSMDNSEFWNKVGSVSIKRRIRYLAKKILGTVHIESVVRRIHK